MPSPRPTDMSVEGQAAEAPAPLVVPGNLNPRLFEAVRAAEQSKAQATSEVMPGYDADTCWSESS